MKPYRDLGIQKKMQVMTLLICGAVLFVAIAALFAFQVLNFRSNFQRESTTLALIIANNSAAAVSAKNAAAATEVISTLGAEPTVISASLVLPDGAEFAHYGKAEDSASRSQFVSQRAAGFVGGQFLATQPVKLKDQCVGTLYLRSDYHRTFLELFGFYRQLDRKSTRLNS